MIEPSIQLSDAEIRRFEEEGYLSIDRITSDEDLEGIRQAYEELFELRSGHDQGDHFDLAGADDEGQPPKLPQILNPARYAPALEQTLYRANAQAIARQLLGPEAEFQFDHAIYKPPRHGAETPWHQDEAYWNPDMEYQSLSIWMPLQEVDAENGCMHFIPGSHRLEVLPHRPIGGDPRVHGLETLEADSSLAVACPLPAGGATIHPGRTLHYAPANHSDRPRRAYILSFGLPPRPLDKPRRFPWLEARQTAREERARNND